MEETQLIATAAHRLTFRELRRRLHALRRAPRPARDVGEGLRRPVDGRPGARLGDQEHNCPVIVRATLAFRFAKFRNNYRGN